MAYIPTATLNWHRDAGFEKRGEPVIYKIIAKTVNYGTGVISESASSTSISKAILGRIIRGESEERTVEIRTADLPVSHPLKGHVLTINTEDWIIMSANKDHAGYVCYIRCTKA